MKLTDEELAISGELTILDQSARYRDLRGRTLTDLYHEEHPLQKRTKREGLLCYDNLHAEKQAKINDPRYTKWTQDMIGYCI